MTILLAIAVWVIVDLGYRAYEDFRDWRWRR